MRGDKEMQISSWVPKELLANFHMGVQTLTCNEEEYRQALFSCVAKYFNFDVENTLHQMFAVQVMLMREMVKNRE
jgi:hypothetical protein